METVPVAIDLSEGDYDASNDPLITLSLERVNRVIEKFTHDAKETEQEYHQDVAGEFMHMNRDFAENELKPHARDDPFMARFRALRGQTIWDFNHNHPDLPSLVGPGSGSRSPEQIDKARQVFETSEELKRFMDGVKEIRAEMISHQAAVEQVTEPDVPQKPDPVVEYLKERGIHISLGVSGGFDPGELEAAIVGAFKRAKIDQDEGAMQELMVQLQIPHDTSEPKSSKYYTKLLAEHINPLEAATAQRRNWLRAAGLPSTVPATRVADPEPIRAPSPPRPTAVMDAGTQLVAPQPKKGAPELADIPDEDDPERADLERRTEALRIRKEKLDKKQEELRSITQAQTSKEQGLRTDISGLDAKLAALPKTQYDLVRKAEEEAIRAAHESALEALNTELELAEEEVGIPPPLEGVSVGTMSQEAMPTDVLQLDSTPPLGRRRRSGLRLALMRKPIQEGARPFGEQPPSPPEPESSPEPEISEEQQAWLDKKNRERKKGHSLLEGKEGKKYALRSGPFTGEERREIAYFGVETTEERRPWKSVGGIERVDMDAGFVTKDVRPFFVREELERARASKKLDIKRMTYTVSMYPGKLRPVQRNLNP